MDFEASVEIAAEKSRDVDTEAFHAETAETEKPHPFLEDQKVFDDWVFDLFCDITNSDLRLLRKSLKRLNDADTTIDRAVEKSHIGSLFSSVIFEAMKKNGIEK